MGEEQKRPFCLHEAVNSSFARFGRVLHSFTSLCRHPTQPTGEAPAQPDAFRVGSVHTILEDEAVDVTNGNKEDVEQGLSHASSSSVRRRQHGYETHCRGSAALWSCLLVVSCQLRPTEALTVCPKAMSKHAVAANAWFACDAHMLIRP
jgi:hypothetical protein